MIFNPIWIGGQNAPLRVFAKYLKSGVADLHETLRLLRPLYRYLLKSKVYIWVIHCCYGNQFNGECLAKNVIKEAKDVASKFLWPMEPRLSRSVSNRDYLVSFILIFIIFYFGGHHDAL